jgi:hypothetical protein
MEVHARKTNRIPVMSNKLIADASMSRAEGKHADETGMIDDEPSAKRRRLEAAEMKEDDPEMEVEVVDSTVYFKCTWPSIRRPGTELAYWLLQHDANDVPSITRLSDGTLFIVFDWTWNYANDTPTELVRSWRKSQRAARREAAKSHEPGRPPIQRSRSIQCLFCPAKYPQQDQAKHALLHPAEYDLVTIFAQSGPPDRSAVATEIDFIVDQFAANIIRRLPLYRRLETGVEFVMTVRRQIFIAAFGRPRQGITVSRMVTNITDQLIYTVHHPEAMVELLGKFWWWWSMLDQAGERMISQVRFGLQVILSDKMGYDGKPIENKVHNKMVLIHTVHRHTHKPGDYDDESPPRVYKTEKMVVSYKRTRAHLLMALDELQ